MRGRADAAIDHLAHPSLAALRHDDRGEIHLIVRRTNAGTQLDGHVRGIASELRTHAFDGHSCNALLAAPAPGMQKPGDAPARIEKINRAAIRHIDAQTHAGIRRD